MKTTLALTHWLLSPLGGATIENLDALFTGGACEECLIPVGERTRRRMRIRYRDALSRRMDGVLAQRSEWPRGPTFPLFSERFLSLLSPAERARFRWRAVDVSNPTRTTPSMFEIVGSAVHASAVALRGGNPDRTRCAACGRLGVPRYPVAECLPGRLRASLPTDIEPPSLYVAADSLPDPAPPWFALGDWREGAWLVVSDERRWRKTPRPGGVGIHLWRVGVVAPALVQMAARA